MIFQIAEGLGIIAKYDPQASVKADMDNIMVVLNDGIMPSDQDAERLRQLGWQWEDREVFLFSTAEDESNDY